MKNRAVAAGLTLMFVCLPSAESADPFRPRIPKTWDDAEMQAVEISLAHAEYSPRHIRAEFYYSMRVRPIYESYPVYHPDREPSGHLDWLRRREPREVWDSSKLRTREDWAKAGELVFDATILYGGIGLRSSAGEDLYVRDRSWYERVRPPLTREGVLPFYRYVTRERGKIELGVLACAMCHTRVLPDGSILKGAQGNFPFDEAFAEDLRASAKTEALNRKLLNALYAKPWLGSYFYSQLERLDAAGMATLFAGRPAGVVTRHRLSVETPSQIPDLIGVRHRKYLDHTGLQLHRGIADMMRYAALNQGGDDFADFGGFVPMASFLGVTRIRPDHGDRYSDEQLFALALYLYSLRPPANPNLLGEETKRGERVFVREGCGDCHTPPLYTNNKLVPAPGFDVPEIHKRKYSILPIRVGTDATATLDTRRGTGYYKIPSLLGVWYRGPFEHSGSVATLEDWFDPRRVSDDYVPTGFRPPTRPKGAVRGHEFGLRLSVDERKALIAFLKTL